MIKTTEKIWVFWRSEKWRISSLKTECLSRLSAIIWLSAEKIHPRLHQSQHFKSWYLFESDLVNIDWFNQSTAEKNWELQSEVCNVSWNISIDLKSLSFDVKTEIKYKVWLNIVSAIRLSTDCLYWWLISLYSTWKFVKAKYQNQKYYLI